MARRDGGPRPRRSPYITPEGAAAMRAEIHQLWKVERPEVTREAAEAAALGDRSENAAYIYAKRRLRQIDARVRFLKKRLDELTIVSEPPDRQDRVYFGAWVELEDEEGRSYTYRIVGPDETDSKRGYISMDSPVGRALLGKEEGDEVTVQRPRGPITFTIMGIRYA